MECAIILFFDRTPPILQCQRRENEDWLSPPMRIDRQGRISGISVALNPQAQAASFPAPCAVVLADISSVRIFRRALCN